MALGRDAVAVDLARIGDDVRDLSNVDDTSDPSIPHLLRVGSAL
jgi:hypothetical protein